MIAEIGLAALWLAAALAVLQMVSGAFALNAAEGRVNPMASMPGLRRWCRPCWLCWRS